VNALAGTVKIIANPSIYYDTMDPSEVKNVFLEELTSLRDGTHVEPLLSKGGAVHEAFLNSYMAINDEALRN
jgi:predicted transcriptional regulator